MKLYSRNNKEDLFDEFSLHLSFPIFKCGILPGNAWGNDYPTKFINVKLNTLVIYRNDKTHWDFELNLLGFGFSITRQTGY